MKNNCIALEVMKLSPKDGDIIVFKVASKNDAEGIIDAIQHSSPIGANCPVLILDRDTEIVLMSADALKKK